MRSTIYAVAFALLALSGAADAQTKVRAKADIDCKPAAEMLQYDCIIRLANSRTGEPLSGLALTVGADMPSMAGMHNVRPVKAAEDPDKGTYKTRLVLEMHGDWALRLDLSGPIRDRVVRMLRFERDRVGEATPTQAPQRHRH